MKINKNFLKNLLLSTLILSSSLVYSMEKLPKEMKKEVLSYIYMDPDLESKSIKELQNILNQISINKKFKENIDPKYYENVIEVIKKKKGLKLTDEWQLREATKKNDDKEMSRLIKNGTNVDAKDKDGMTPLMWAAALNKVNAARVLIESGANVNEKDNKGFTALKIANNNNNIRIATLIENSIIAKSLPFKIKYINFDNK